MRTFIFSFIFILLSTMVIGNLKIGDIICNPKDPESTNEQEDTEDTIEYNVIEIREMFELSTKQLWMIYDNRCKIEYPDFMKEERDWDSKFMRVSFHDVVMTAKVFEDEYDMSIREKYEALNMSAVTKSISDNSFLMAGRTFDNMRYFEKFMLLNYRTWLYLRVDFPKELTWAVDPLLHYVKDYNPNFAWNNKY